MEAKNCGRSNFKKIDNIVFRPFDTLSEELLYHIFSFLPPNMYFFSDYALTSKQWHRIFFDPKLITQLFSQIYPSIVSKFTKGELSRESLLKEISFVDRLISNFNPVVTSFYCCYQTIKSFDCNNRGIVVLGYCDRIIGLWDFKGKLINEISYKDNLDFVRIINDKIICAKSEKLIILDLKGNVIKEIEAHKRPICSLFIDKDHIFSGSEGYIIKIWDLEGNLIQTLLGHSQAINAISIYNCQLISASDQEVILWDLKNITSKAFNEIKYVNAITMNENCFITGSLKGHIQIWDLEGNNIADFRAHSDLISSLSIVEGMLVSASRDETIKIWNLKTCKLIKILKLERGCKVKIIDGKIVSGSGTGVVRVWDYFDVDPQAIPTKAPVACTLM